VEDVHDVDTDVEADEVGEFEGAFLATIFVEAAGGFAAEVAGGDVFFE